MALAQILAAVDMNTLWTPREVLGAAAARVAATNDLSDLDGEDAPN